MSNKSARKVNLPKTTNVPRDLPAIEADYIQLRSEAGQVQYQLHVFNKDLVRLNERLENLNYEAAARKELDSKAAPAATEQENTNATA